MPPIAREPLGAHYMCQNEELSVNDLHSAVESEATCESTLLRLPRDILLKCVLNFDYQALGLASCASKELRSLVQLVSWQPYWVTSVEERPAILITQFETAASLQQACNGWVDSFLRRAAGKGAPHLCLVFASPSPSTNLAALIDTLRSRLPGCCTLAGMVCHGVLGKDSGGAGVSELDDSEAPLLAVSLVRFPTGTRVHTAHLAQSPLGTFVHAGELPPAGSSGQHRTWLAFGGDQLPSVDAVLADLGRKYPHSRIVGGVAGGIVPAASLIVGLPRQCPGQPLHAHITTGTLCISIDSPLVVRELLTTRGVRCVSTAHVITRVDPDVNIAGSGPVTLIQEMSNRIRLKSKECPRTWVPVGPSFTPTSALVSALHQQHGGVDPRSPLFLGVQPPCPSGEVDFAKMCLHQLHDPHDIMRSSGSMPVQRPVPEGASAAFFVPDPQLASRQLEEGLELAAEELWLEPPTITPTVSPTLPPEVALQRERPSPVFGTLAFVCAGRGRKFYTEGGVESGLISAAFPETEMCGCFCAGEIGAVPSEEGDFEDGAPAHVLGFTTVLGLFKLMPSAEPGLLAGEEGSLAVEAPLPSQQQPQPVPGPGPGPGPGSSFWPEVPGAAIPHTLRMRIAGAVDSA